MGKLDRIVHILFLLAIIAFSAVYYFQVSRLPLPGEKEVVNIILFLLLIFVLIQLWRLVFTFHSEESKIQNNNVPRSQLRLGQLLKDKSLILLLTTVAYLPSIVVLGTYTASFIYMVILSYALGARNIKKTVVINFIVLAVFYLFFVTFLDIKFPKGISF
ncbi:MAG: hypothetical protein JRJ02_02705 [Deltaproteobacteria bacterium]|nr:hypothetical protein [Deltaproteobacteria bacterium]